jgi:hypothetical protein
MRGHSPAHKKARRLACSSSPFSRGPKNGLSRSRSSANIPW